jgi:hypothetical protein
VTPAALNRIIATWQKRLKLDHIRIMVDLDDQPENPNALAAVVPDGLYDLATMVFRDDWSEHTPFELNRIVVHELLHIMFRDYGNAIRSIGQAGILSHQVEVLWHDRCVDAEEGLIDRLAHRLVEIGGIVK